MSGFSVANYQYVFYVGDDSDIHQMLYNNVGWVDTDLTVASGSLVYGQGGSNIVAFHFTRTARLLRSVPTRTFTKSLPPTGPIGRTRI